MSGRTVTWMTPLTLVRRFRNSYWFIPTIMALGAAALALTLVEVEGYVPARWISDAGWLFLTGPEGARALLAAVAGSMITVAGVTFSITIVSVFNATARFGPRLLSNFMRDTGNQVTLGTFIATFVYSILVLRTVRGATGDLTDVSLGPPFIPHLAVFVGVLLALTSLGVLIYFIHHVAGSIHVASMLARVGRELTGEIERLWSKEDLPGGSSVSMRLPAEEHGVPLAAPRSGYIEAIDEEGIGEAARTRDLIVRLHVRAGEFICAGESVLTVWGASPSALRFEQELGEYLAIGDSRTGSDDIPYLFGELLQVISIALSPGINDPMTAMAAMDWLKDALRELLVRPMQRELLLDREGTGRVVRRPLRSDDIIRFVFRYARESVQSDGVARPYMRQMVEVLLGFAIREDDRDALREALQWLEHGELAEGRQIGTRPTYSLDGAPSCNTQAGCAIPESLSRGQPSPEGR